MFKKTLASSSVLALALAAGSAHAGGYVGGSAGYTDFPNEFDGAASLAATGGYQVNDYFAVEASYLYLGESDEDVSFEPQEVELTGFNFSAVGIFPATKQIDLFGKVGVLVWDVDQSGPEGDSSFDGNDLSLGLGGAFHVTQEFSIIAEVQRFEIEDESLTNFSVGARLNF